MQRKKTKNTRLADSSEKAFMSWVKEQSCICCGNEPVIVDHIWGATKKTYVGVERVLIGHWALLPLCQACDNIKTKGSRKAFRKACGSPIDLWEKLIGHYQEDIPINVITGILRCQE